MATSDRDRDCDELPSLLRELFDDGELKEAALGEGWVSEVYSRDAVQREFDRSRAPRTIEIKPDWIIEAREDPLTCTEEIEPDWAIEADALGPTEEIDPDWIVDEQPAPDPPSACAVVRRRRIVDE